MPQTQVLILPVHCVPMTYVSWSNRRSNDPDQAGRQLVVGVSISYSYELISDYKLQLPLEPNVRQGSCAIFSQLQYRGSDAQKSEIGILRRSCGKSTKGFCIAPEQFVWVVGQVSRKDCRLGFPIKNFACYCLAGNRHTEDTGKLLASAPHHCLLGGANSGKSNNIDMRSGKLGLSHFVLDQTLEDSLKTVVTRVMEMVRLGGG